MRRCFTAFLALVAALSLVMPGLASPQWTGPSLKSSFMPAADYCAEPEELAFLKLINDYRAQNGVGPLVLSQTLGAASEHHSIDMATNNYFSHTLSDGTSWDQNMTAHGYTYSTYRGENIAAGYETAANTFTQWKNSPGHNANMLSSVFTAIGIGRAYNSTATYRWYWTTDFGGYADASAQACPTGSTPTPTRVVTATSTPVTQPTSTSTAVPQPTATATVAPPTATTAPSPAVYVSGMSGKSATRKSTRTVTVTVKVADSSGSSVGGAVVTLVITAPDGTSQLVTATTNGRGQASLSATVPSAGSYLASIASISAGSSRYDPSRNMVNSVAITVR